MLLLDVAALAKLASTFMLLLFALVNLAVIVGALAVGSVLPLLLVGAVPSMLGAWLMVFFGSTQHLGLAEDVLDHRESTRTVLTNPVFEQIVDM